MYMKKCAIYVRVSTEDQELENQIEQLREYADKSDWQVYKIYKDVISGKENSRPGFDRLFDDAHKKLFDVVLFWDITRFSRSGTLFTLQKLNELEKIGISWHSYQDRYFSTLGPWKDVVISIMATLGKVERERISERTKAGLARARREGKRIGRPSVDEEKVEQVKHFLREEIFSYREISGRVGVSPAKISEIKKEMKK